MKETEEAEEFEDFGALEFCQKNSLIFSGKYGTKNCFFPSMQSKQRINQSKISKLKQFAGKSFKWKALQVLNP